MDMRERILDVARRLTIERGLIPSLNVVAEAAGVSKGGLIHHFPTRAALVEGLARGALDEIDREMTAAAASGSVAAAWLRLSVPSGEDLDLFRALAVTHRAMDANLAGVIDAADDAVTRWERLISDELGDPAQARIVRLVGDGLAMNAIAGMRTPMGLDELISQLTEPVRKRR